MGAAMAEKPLVSAKAWATALAGVVLGLATLHSLPSSGAAGASPGTETAVTLVDRTHKGDRLDAAAAPASEAQAIGRMTLRHLMQRARIERLQDACEPPASPFVDPQLAKLPGRCIT
jgi:hypothetical protein